MSDTQIIVGLEIGTSKVCVAVGEVSDNQVVNIIGLGQSKSRGVRKGEIVDASLVEEDVRNAIVEAEHMADVEIRSVFLGVSGSHMRGFNNSGVLPVVSADREITNADIQDVIKNAKAINLPSDHSVVHVIRQHFRVDGQDGVLSRACWALRSRSTSTWSVAATTGCRILFALSADCISRWTISRSTDWPPRSRY